MLASLLAVVTLGLQGPLAEQPTRVVDGERYLMPIGTSTTTGATGARTLPPRRSAVVAFAAKGGLSWASWGDGAASGSSPLVSMAAGVDWRPHRLMGWTTDLGFGLATRSGDGGTAADIPFFFLGFETGPELRLPLGSWVRFVAGAGGHLQWTTSQTVDEVGAGVQGGAGVELGTSDGIALQGRLEARQTWSGDLDPTVVGVTFRLRLPLIR